MTFPSAESDQPIRNLRGFCKEKYAVGESQTLTFPIRAKDMTVWSVERQTFYVR
jgi:beta-glucosidase